LSNPLVRRINFLPQVRNRGAISLYFFLPRSSRPAL